jgi:hypothetical protein
MVSPWFQAGDAVLPLLPEAMNTLSAASEAAAEEAMAEEDQSAPFADRDALSAAVVLTAAFLADPRGRDALDTHAEEHAGAIVSALCRLGAGGGGAMNLAGRCRLTLSNPR